MISYQIISKHISHKPENTSLESRRVKVFERATARAVKVLKPGDSVVFGGNRKATIVEVVLDITKISWKGVKPFFIKIKFDDTGTMGLTHISSLRIKR